MAEELKKLRCSRGQFKKQHTLIKKHIDSLDNKLSPLDVKNLRLRTDKFQNDFTNFESIQCQIEQLCENNDEVKDQKEIELTEGEKVVCDYFDILSVIEIILEKYEKPITLPQHNPQPLQQQPPINIQVVAPPNMGSGTPKSNFYPCRIYLNSLAVLTNG